MQDGAWYAAAALAEVGGTRFAARLHEIRNGADGERAIDYECRAVGASDTAFEYRLRPDLPAPEKKTQKKRQSASALIKAQAEEIARLQAELAKAIAGRVKQVRGHQAQASLFGGSPP
jgi:hypothetical protein